MTLELRELVVRFPTGFQVGPVSLRVDPGIWRIAGDNGTGKTTLLKAICGEIAPTGGAVRIDGEDPVSDPFARRLVGYVPSRPELPGYLTVDEAWETLAALRRAPGWSGAALRDRLELDGRLRLEHASDGQRRRAELLAGLAGDPPVVLLDEPLANLDAHAATLVAGLLDARRGAQAIVLAHHGPSPIRVDGELTLGRGSASFARS